MQFMQPVVMHTLSPAQKLARATLSDALAQEDQGNLPQAFSRFQAAVRLDPTCGRAWRHLGNLLRRSGELGAASECFERAMATGDDRQLNEFFLSAVGVGPLVKAAPGHFVAALFDQYAQRFDAHLTTELKYFAPQLLFDLVTANSPSHFEKTLDLGCGTGLAAKAFSTVCAHIQGVDLSQQMLDRARDSCVYEALVLASMQEYLESTPHTYDLILCCDALIYLGDLAAVFAGVRRTLAPGGAFGLTVELCEADAGFDLLPSLRYAHSERYIRQLAEHNQFQVLGVAKGSLREEDHQPVHGMAFHLGRTEEPGA
jgi:predicted TPR repeat methyltransferase